MPTHQKHYVLITAARNEERYIGACIESVLSQTLLPNKWVIVSDASSDDTDRIIQKYAQKNQLIRFKKKNHDPEVQGFCSKVAALNMGASFLADLDWRLIGHLDADITLGVNYYAMMLEKFIDNERLGIGGGYIFENQKGAFKSRAMNSLWSVAGGIQLFRRECYRDIEGLSPMPFGGEDWHAEIKARMKGWEVKAFPEIPAYHHNPGTGKRGAVEEGVRCGTMDYSIGTHPLFEIFKCLRRIKEKPILIFAVLQFLGFMRGYLLQHTRKTAKDEMDFLRKEQLSRLKNILFFYKGKHAKI